MTSLKNDDRQFWHLSKNIALGLKHLRKMNLSFLVHCLATKSQADLLETKIIELEKGNGIVEIDAHYEFLC